MRYFPFDVSLLRLGEPLPVSLWDDRGTLLLPRGAVMRDDAQRRRLAARKPQVRSDDHDRLLGPWLLAMEQMVLRDEPLGRIAGLRPREVESPTAAATPLPVPEVDPLDLLGDLQMHLRKTLHDPKSEDFTDRLMRDADALTDLMREDPDASLLVLLHDAARDSLEYGVHHSLVVAAVSALVAIEHPAVWPQADIQRLALAGLTMNLSVLSLHDQLAAQEEDLSDQQRTELKAHGLRSAQLLRQVGFVDEALLLTVALHHHVAPQPSVDSVAGLAPELASRYRARLIHKVDAYTAKLSPRRQRPGMSATQAARSAFLDRNGDTDPVGSWVLKTIGLYPPGTLVMMRNGEAGIVHSRGPRAHAPWVAVLVSASGLPLSRPHLVDTGEESRAVVQAMTPSQLRVQVPLHAVLALKPKRSPQDEASTDSSC